MLFTLEKLKTRLPEIIAAATLDIQPLSPVRTCPAVGAVAASAMAPPPPPHVSDWILLLPGLVWGIPSEQTIPATLEQPGWNTLTYEGSTHWLLTSFTLPPTWQGQQVLLHIAWEGAEPSHPEAIVYLDGEVLAGLDEFHPTILLPDTAHSGDHTLLLRCYLPYPQPFGGLSLQLRDAAIFQLGQMMRVLLAAVETYHPSAPLRHWLLSQLNTAYTMLDLREGWQSPCFAQSARAALEMLQQALSAEQRAQRQPTIIATGHAHLDVAWLWPLWRTRQKTVHTVATALHLMERYPDYRFSMSQPYLYATLKQDAPNLYAQLKQRTSEGRFEPVGSMWLETDCNLTSGESLVRHFLHGAQFLNQEFGTAVQIAWLPDTFGYSAALPQLMRGCGISCLFTTKLSWNQFNRMPADTFRWRGIDGSEVLVHVGTAPENPDDRTTPLPRYTYVGQMSVDQVSGTWEHYREKPINDELLYVYGWGDGGGGPTEEMLEAMEVLSKLPGLPQVQPGRVDQFFQRLYERVWDHPDLPVWVGELYLEYHRGTYTSQAATKLNNRVAELSYRKAEWLNAWAHVLGAADQQPRLNAGWRLILLNQFHDILPGSSIAQVYQDSERQYEHVQQIAHEVRQAAQAAILATLAGKPENEPQPEPQTQVADTFYIFNSLPWERFETVWVALPSDNPFLEAPPLFATVDGVTLVTQVVEERPGEPGMLVNVQVPSYGYRPVNVIHQSSDEAPPSDVYASMQVTENRLSNGLLYLELDAQGEIISLYDREYGRELIAPGTTGNQLVTYEDRPLSWDAWDIDPFYTEKPYPVHTIQESRVVERGPLRAGIEIVRRIGRSTIWQRIYLWHQRRRIDFVTEVDWQERQTLLRVLFPLNLNTAFATCEIQFGALERPTHRNTSWEQARFEVCAHRWVDLSEGGYGVALLNDGKYGHSLHHNSLGLSLLRSPIQPDPTADQGHHAFTYSLLPHAGDWRTAQVVRRAYELNVPLSVYHHDRNDPEYTDETHSYGDTPANISIHTSMSRSFLTTPTDHVVVETIKVAEDGDGIIVRLYEAHNQRGPVCLIFGHPVTAAIEVDLLEREISSVTVAERQLFFDIRPFEVKTLRVWFDTGA